MVNQKSIVLVPFPFSDLSGRKIRPAVIISNPEFNKAEDVIICALTSSIKRRPYSIMISEKDTENKKLRDTSQLRVDTVTRTDRRVKAGNTRT